MTLKTYNTQEIKTKVLKQLQEIIEIVPENMQRKIEIIEVRILNTTSHSELEIYYKQLENVYRNYIKENTLKNIH